MHITPMPCASALHQLKRKIPYGWDLNLYRGCSHGCVYCYAMSSHPYLGKEACNGEIFYKENILTHLEKELASSSWKQEVVNIGGVTDSYQPAEAICQLMPEVLKLLIKYRTPAIISTKSSLILRDYDLIAELAAITYVNVAATIITMDEKMARLLEPGGDSIANRCYTLKEYRKSKACIGWHLMPILPYLTDGADNLKEIFKTARDCKVDYLLPGTLYLRGKTRNYFFAFLEREFPHLAEAYQQLYPKGGASPAYKNILYQRINQLRKDYGVSGDYTTPMRARLRR